MKHYFTILATFLTAIFVMTSCSSNDEPSSLPTEITYVGDITSSIPKMNFTAEPSTVNAKVSWTNSSRTKCTVDVGGFSVTVPQMGMSIEIGDMKITNVDCTAISDGVYDLKVDNFNCQAGKYDTNGSLTGKIANGKLQLTLTYIPGSMPYDVVSVFAGSASTK